MSTTTDRDARNGADDAPHPDQPGSRPRPRPRHRRVPTPEIAAPVAVDERATSQAPGPATDEGFSLWPWLGGVLGRYWMPPALWREPAASLEDLSDYAHRGEWASRQGLLRACGIAWWRLVGLPVTAFCRRLEWVAQRPGRFLTVLVLFELLARTSYGRIALHWLALPLRGLAWLLF